jgi:hypothetical protein
MSYLGAAITTVICEAGLLVAFAVLLRRAVGRSQLVRAHGWPLLASVPMGAVLIATAGQHVLVSAVAGAAVYAAAVVGLAALRAGPGRRRPDRALAALVSPPA